MPWPRSSGRCRRLVRRRLARVEETAVAEPPGARGARGRVVRIRVREDGDLDRCVQALAAVHQTSGYPANWPADPAGWLTPGGMAGAWVATTAAEPVAGH